MAVFLSIIGVVLLVYGASLCFFSNMNTGVIMVFALGGFLMLWGMFYNTVNSVTSEGLMKYVKYIIIAIMVSMLALIGFVAIYGEMDNADCDEDAVVVLGAAIQGDKVLSSLQARLDKAVEYSEKNPGALIVVTGGQGPQETVTEAYAMEKYLVENGVDKSRILKEEKATSTNENMRFSKEILDKRLPKGYKIVFITNDFHIYRSAKIAKAEGFEKVTHINTPVRWYNYIPFYLREILAIVKMWVFG